LTVGQGGQKVNQPPKLFWEVANKEETMRRNRKIKLAIVPVAPDKTLALPAFGCANPRSPRAGLLTFRDQGCWQFGPEKGERAEGTLLKRGGFRECFERILREQARNFILEQVRLASDPLTGKEDAPAGPENIRESVLFIMLRRLLRQAGEDFCRQPVDEMVARARWDCSRYWEYARRYWARTFGLDVSEIRLPRTTWDLEEEFWGRVDAIIGGALGERVERDEE
jgi:hypothetical protein